MFESGDDGDDDVVVVVVVFGLFGGSESTYIKLELISMQMEQSSKSHVSLTVDIFFLDHTFLLRQRRGEILISQYGHEEWAR